MELNQFISGERFQGLADISFIPIGNGVGESECDFVKTQQINNNYNTYYYSENTILPHLPGIKIIFVNTWTLPKFFRVIFPQLRGNYIFISHNSDMGLANEYKQFLDSDKVIKWYSQNKSIDHEKACSLPIGLGNSQYPHGNLPLLKKTIEKNKQKTKLICKNFNVNTNPSSRSYIDFVTNINGFKMQSKVSQEEYFDALADYSFCFSPPGNGIDCHRIWECLYLKTIPIVEYHDCFKDFKHLPILFVTDWNSITFDFLNKNLGMLAKFKEPMPELNMEYWKGKII